MTSLTQSITIEAPPAAVYRALSSPLALRDWLCDSAESDVREGGRLVLLWNSGRWAVGQWTSLAPGERLACALFFHGPGAAPPNDLRVAYELRPTAGGTQLLVEYSAIDDEAERQQVERDWQRALPNLKAVLETGLDQRIYSRPMLGLLLRGELDAAGAAELGVPEARGVRLGGTIEGLGAAAAGLQADDVIVSINDTPIATVDSFGAALGGSRAGDSVLVGFQRGAELRQATMVLSARPAPAHPGDPAAFAAAVGAVHVQLDDELAAILAEARAEETTSRPAPGAWSAVEVIAHLVATEREFQIAQAFRLSDIPLERFPDNPPAWVQSIVAVHPTSGELLNLLRQTERETVALVAALPAEFAANRIAYLDLAATLLQGMPSHSRLHFEQIRAAIAAARAAGAAG